MEPKEDTRNGFYIVNVGTNKLWHTEPKQPLICDTADIAQAHIDEIVKYRAKSGMPALPLVCPISIAEYNKKYVVEGA